MSTRITKMAANKVAEILTVKKRAEVKDAKDKMGEFVTALFEATVPTPIMESFAKFPQFFKRKGYVYLSGAGIQSYESVQLSKDLPNPEEQFQMKSHNAEKFIKLKRAWEEKKNELKKLELDVEKAVFNARTYKRIAELFPEAVPHLPAVFPPPAINYSDIRKRIK